MYSLEAHTQISITLSLKLEYWLETNDDVKELEKVCKKDLLCLQYLLMHLQPWY